MDQCYGCCETQINVGGDELEVEIGGGGCGGRKPKVVSSGGG